MIRSLVTHNFGLKMLSLGSALLAWVLFSGTRQLSMSISVPIQYRNLPPNLDVSSEMVEQVHLSLRGAPSRLARITPASLPIVIDMQNVASGGERTFSINKENVQLPDRVFLERVVPSQIRLTLETRMHKEVPVVVRMASGNPIPTLTWPDKLTIVGPESRVSRIREVETDPIDSQALRSRGEVRTEVFSGDPQVRFAGSSMVRVTASKDSEKHN